MKRALILVGPTAVGKTKLSLRLAHWLNGEVISCDSMQVYRYLNIGTAKLMPEDREGIPHHLIDIRTIYQRYAVTDFIADALRLIDQITARGRLPIVVGGSNLYLQSLLDDFSFGGDRFKGFGLRKRLKYFAEMKGSVTLWKRLARVDPQSARQIPHQNVRRVVRALEVYLRTGRQFSQQKLIRRKGINFLVIGLRTKRALLYQQINRRVDVMMKSGLLTEAKWLFDCGGAALPAGMGIGYHELYPYFKHQISLDRAVQLIKRDSRHYAKRQLTWFRNQMRVNWFDLIQNPQSVKSLRKLIVQWLR